jgi:hypothetical protein
MTAGERLLVEGERLRTFIALNRAKTNSELERIMLEHRKALRRLRLYGLSAEGLAEALGRTVE